MKLMVLSAVHRVNSSRRQVYEFFCRRMEALNKRFGLETLVVGSEGEVSRQATEDFGLHYFEFKNKPLSNKWNAGMEEIRKHNPSHVMILGSDDIVCDRLIEEYLKFLDTDYNIFGIIDSYYFGLNELRAKFGVCGYWPGYGKKSMLGYARVFRSDVLDQVLWRPWRDGRNSGLDFSVNVKFRQHGVKVYQHKMSIKEKDFLHIDIKSHGNISSMAPIARRGMVEVDYAPLLRKYLPEEEAEAIIDYANDWIKLHQR